MWYFRLLLTRKPLETRPIAAHCAVKEGARPDACARNRLKPVGAIAGRHCTIPERFARKTYVLDGGAIKGKAFGMPNRRQQALVGDLVRKCFFA